jgi:hypothetical protein
MSYWLDERFIEERAEDRREQFRAIGKKVYAFFDKAIVNGYQDREGRWEMS